MADGGRHKTLQLADLRYLRAAVLRSRGEIADFRPGVLRLVDYAEAAGEEVRRLRAVVDGSEAATAKAKAVIAAYLTVDDETSAALAAAMAREIVEDLKASGLAIVERGAV